MARKKSLIIKEEPSRKLVQGPRGRIRLGKVEALQWAGGTGADGHRKGVIQGRVREGSMARGRGQEEEV